LSEILKYKGRLGEKELEAKQLRLGADGLVKSLRDTLDPFEPVEELNIELAFQEMTNLTKTVFTLKTIVNEITAIKKALGR